VHNRLLKYLKFRRRDVIGFLASLLLAFTFWGVHNLSLRYSGTISVPVIIESNLPGRAKVSEYPVDIVARCRATGYDFLFSGRKPVLVAVDPSHLKETEGDFFSISATDLTQYIEDIFGSGISLESFMVQSYKFKFAVENNKTVPVEFVSNMTFRPQYCIHGKITVDPDSVIVYGPPEVIRNVNRVCTDVQNFNNVSSLKHGTIKLIVPSGTRLSEEQAHYMMSVSRYVEVKKTVKVETRNVPEKKEFMVFPSNAQVTFKCIFPVTDDLTRDVRFYIDYEDFARSVNGRCVARSDEMPTDILDYTIDPQVFECFETESE